MWGEGGGGQGGRRKWRLSKKYESLIPPFHGLSTALSRKGGSDSSSGVGPAQFQKSTQFLGLLLTAEQLLQALHWHAWLVYGLGCSRGDAPAGALVSSEEWHPQASPAQLLWGTAPVCPSAAWAPAWLDLPTARRVNGKSSVL